jgi:ankyrin repeat protein
LLLRAGANIDAQTAHGLSPLFCASDVSVAALLIAANANLMLVDREGRSVCHRAVLHPRVLALLIAAGANPHLRGDDGETALHCAAEENNSSDAMSMLLDAGADVNQADNDGNCAAHWAACSSRVDNLKFLLEHGAQFNQRNNAGKTVFGVAAASTDACETMRWLLDSGADIGAIDITAAQVLIGRLYCCCARWVSILMTQTNMAILRVTMCATVRRLRCSLRLVRLRL